MVKTTMQHCIDVYINALSSDNSNEIDTNRHTQLADRIAITITIVMASQTLSVTAIVK